jgi:hypothetical protein
MGVGKETLAGNNKKGVKEGCLVQLTVETTTTNLLHSSIMPSENVITERVWKGKNTKNC